MNKDAIYIDTQRPRRRPPVRRARWIPVKGQPIEAYQYEKLGKCWFCGDINTTGRDEEDTGHSSISGQYSMPVVRSLGTRGQTIEESLSVNRMIFSTKVAPEAGANGAARAIKNVWTIVSYRGCKSCGTATWSGRK